MRFDVQAPVLGGKTADPDWIGPFAQHVEACGFDGIVVVEHAVVTNGYDPTYPYTADGRMELPVDCPIPDPIELLTFLAALTDRVELATGVLVLPNHHPVVLAKRVATLDVLSRGRVRLAVGVGWMAEEILACGVDFDSRGRRAEEQIEVLRALWADTGTSGASHHGEFFDFDAAVSMPKPLRPTGVPIHIGGHSRIAARRAGRLADGLQPIGVDAASLTTLLDMMRSEASQCGRDPDALEVTLAHSVDSVTDDRAAHLGELGADRLVLKVGPSTDLDRVCDALSECADRLGLAQASRTDRSSGVVQAP